MIDDADDADDDREVIRERAKAPPLPPPPPPISNGEPPPHCRDPKRCSVCIGAAARRVDIVAGVVKLDGESAGRAADPGRDLAAPRAGRPSKKVLEARAAAKERLAAEVEAA